ncbi:unnamed protein product [Durusdinium trenchii]|uniref:Uncharacterized protein n=1 Tax=Durusdinium trenchii TaxID=1381693 RepID=A0ABP0KLU0_9DINO
MVARKGMTAEEKEKAGKKIFAGLVAAIVALVGFVIWRRRRKSSPPSSAGTDGGGATSPKSGKPPPPKRDFLTRVKKPLTEAAVLHKRECVHD